MEENNSIKIGLKTVVIISIIVMILIIGVIVMIINISKNEPSQNLINLYTSSQEISNGEYIYNKEIQSIMIKYYQGYNIATGNAISDTIPLNTINLKENDLNEIASFISKLQKIEYKETSEMYNHIIYDHVCDYYELEINNDFVIFIGDEYGYTEKTNDYFKVSKEFYDKVSEIVNKNNEENLYKTLNSENITIIHNKEKINVTDKEQLKQLSNYQYYIINGTDEEFKENKIAYSLDLNDGRKIDIHYASVISCMYYEDGSHKYIYTGDLEKYIERILKTH